MEKPKKLKVTFLAKPQESQLTLVKVINVPVQ
jgi:hypothetical protein